MAEGGMISDMFTGQLRPPADEHAAPLPREEWCRRFVEHMVAQAPGEFFDDSTPVRPYAEDAAENCFADPTLIREFAADPEGAAEADMEYWGE